MTAARAVRHNTVDGLVRDTARRVPDRTALRYRERSWTYAELDAAVSTGAAVLRERYGLAHGDRVATFAHNSDAYLLAFLACARAGLTHVPVNQNLTGEDLAHILDDCASALVLADPDLASRVPGGRPVRPLRDAPGSFLDELAEPRDFTPDRDAYGVVQLLYTSGTTAAPKGAMMTHEALAHEYESAIEALDLAEGDRPVHSLPLYHSAQTHVFLLPYLAVGAENTVLGRAGRRGDLRPGGGGPGRQPVRATDGVDRARGPPRLRAARSGRAAQGLLRGLDHAGAGPGAAAGPAARAGLLQLLRPERDRAAGHRARAGRARGADGVLRAAGTARRGEGRRRGRGGGARRYGGEVVYRSPQLCLGYWNDPEATKKAFRDGWFRSGDLAVRDAQGYFTVVDRVKDVINSGGVLVASRQVEDALYTHPGVAEAAVVGLPDERWIEAVTAVVVPRGEVTEEELLAYAREKLAHFKAPKRVLFVDALPRNASGKILKRELRTRFGGQSDH
ncbi:hypothetical protein GCM10020254_71970 [Streptomyces goshikiensis]